MLSVQTAHDRKFDATLIPAHGAPPRSALIYCHRRCLQTCTRIRIRSVNDSSKLVEGNTCQPDTATDNALINGLQTSKLVGHRAQIQFRFRDNFSLQLKQQL